MSVRTATNLIRTRRLPRFVATAVLVLGGAVGLAAPAQAHDALTPSVVDRPPASGRPSYSVSNASSPTTTTVKPDFFVGFCITTWGGNMAGSNCTYGVGVYYQVIQCTAVPHQVVGPNTVAPSVFIGRCPHGLVVEAHVTFP
jgi:hypothetical protein